MNEWSASCCRGQRMMNSQSLSKSSALVLIIFNVIITIITIIIFVTIISKLFWLLVNPSKIVLRFRPQKIMPNGDGNDVNEDDGVGEDVRNHGYGVDYDDDDDMFEDITKWFLLFTNLWSGKKRWFSPYKGVKIFLSSFFSSYLSSYLSSYFHMCTILLHPCKHHHNL